MRKNNFADFGYPWGSTLTSFLEIKPDVEVVKTSLLNLIMYSLSEVPMIPLLGTAVSQSVFDQSDDVMMSSLDSSIREAVELYEDRVELVDLQIAQNHAAKTVEVQLIVDYLPTDEKNVYIGFSLPRNG
jgi:phage baseplate assembly protein W